MWHENYTSIIFHSHFSNPSKVQSQILSLLRYITLFHTASNILFTWWNFPSVMVRRIFLSSTFATLAGKVKYPSSRVTQDSNCLQFSSEIADSKWTSYSFSFSHLGLMTLWINWPSLLSNNNHSVSWSNLQATCTRFT